MKKIRITESQLNRIVRSTLREDAGMGVEGRAESMVSWLLKRYGNKVSAYSWEQCLNDPAIYHDIEKGVNTIAGEYGISSREALEYMGAAFKMLKK